MKATEAIREIMRIREVKPSMLATTLNLKKSNVLSERLGQKNMSVIKMNEMLDVLDYKMVVVPRDWEIPENGFEID